MTKTKKILRVYTIDGRYYMFVGSYAKHMLKSIEQAVDYKSIRTKPHKDISWCRSIFYITKYSKYGGNI